MRSTSLEVQRAPAMTGKRPGRATIAVSVGLVVAIWALNFIAAKIGLRHLEPLAMATFRVVLAGLVMVPVYFVCRRSPAFAQPGLSSLRFSARNLWIFTYLGFFSVVLNQICFTVGLRYTSVGHAAVIVGMGPVYILVLACLMQLERFTLRKATGMAIAFGGVILLAAESKMGAHSPTLLGDFITMGGSVGFSLYAVLGKRVASEFDTLTMTAFNHFAGAAMALPLAAYEGWKIGAAANWAAIGWESWVATAYMAVFGSAAAYLLYFWLLRYMPASQLSAFSYLLPVVATILGILWLGEPGTWGLFAGGALVLAGVYWIESGRELELDAEDNRMSR